MTLACALLAGHPQTAMYVFYATLAYGIFLVGSSGDGFRVSRLFLLLVPLALGVALAAVQLVPTLAFIARSTRAHLDYDAVAWGFPLVETIHLIYPDPLGGSPQYVGVLPLVLAGAALFVRQARQQVAFWAAAGMVALLLSFGGHTFFYDLAYLLLPGLSVVRNQERIIYLFSFAASVLAGYGALALVQAWPRFERLGRGLGWTGVAFLAVGLIWLDLFTVNGHFNLADPKAGGPFPETGLVAFLKAQPGTFRISSLGLLPGGAGAGAVYELEDVTATTPLRLDAFERFEQRVALWRQWQLLNVRYVLDRKDIDRPWLQRVYEEDGVKVYRAGDSLPRAWVVGSAVIVDDEQALAVLNAYDFNPMAMALLAPGSEGIALSGGPGSAARVVEAAPGRLVLEVSPQGDGLLVVSQPFYPGWRARVDGKQTPVYRADYLLQAVPVSAAARRVVLTYHLSPLPALVSLTALAGCIAGLAIGRRRT
jgi:hypothetical protein